MAQVSSIGVESRFAVLTKKNKKKPKKPEEPNVTNAKGTSNKTSRKPQHNEPKKKQHVSHPPLIGLPGNHVEEDPEEKKKRKRKKKTPNQTSQWDEWKQKDDALLDKEFEKSIEQVMAMSKLEQKRKLMIPPVIITSTHQNKSNQPSKPDNPVATNGVVTTSKHGTQVKKKNVLVPDNILDGHINSENFKILLSQKDKEIKVLKDGLEKLQLEMKQIRQRNKTLCTIISEGEIKSKADLILELENITKVKDELLNEVNSLNVQLEQERSKVHLLTCQDRNNKDKNKKSRKKSESERNS